jgi:hypothetical protein
MASRGAQSRILNLLLGNVGVEIAREDIQRVAAISEWARRVRELVEAGWDIETTSAGYVLQSLDRKAVETVRIGVNAKLRYRILKRDKSKCRRCGQTVDDGVKLVIDHIVPVAWGGPTEETNLWSLCEECNLGKKAYESDVDAAAMKEVMRHSAARDRIRAYFELKPNQSISREEIQIVSGISEYARRIRELRDEEGMDIQVAKARGDYIYKPRSSVKS